MENSQFNCSEVYIRRLRRQLIRDIFYRVPLCGSTAEEINDYYCYHLLPMAYQIIILRVIPKGYAQGAPSPELLSRVEGCVGLKTGYTRAAGRTLVSCAERDGVRLVAVTLQDGDDWNDHAALYDRGFRVMRPVKAVERGLRCALAQTAQGGET